MHLTHLFRHQPVIRREGTGDPVVSGVAFDSRKVAAGSLFVAVPGMQVDGHAFVEKAIEAGAKAVVLERMPDLRDPEVVYLQVENSARALAELSAAFYDYPARKLTMIGVTGTNGKTTVATLFYQLLAEMGETAGLVSTVAYRVGDEVLPASHTTPDPVQLQALFAQMVEAGCGFCCMEVSSHALHQQRVAGIPFKLAMFTNLTHDHLDYHGTFKNYLAAKKLLFDGLGTEAVAIVNADDRNHRVMVQNTAARFKTFALKRMAAYHGKLLENTLEGLRLEIDGREGWFRLRGSFNAANLLAVYAGAVELGFEPEEVLAGLSALPGAAGRFEVMQQPAAQLTAVVDYAHTPDALENVLQTLRDIHRGQGRVITVVGCGGNRDQAKRPEMARIAARLSEQVVLTSDNPRHEDPETIIAQMWAGIGLESRRQVLRITDRREAIRTACTLAQPGDLILVAGKGHETYQEIKGVRHPFDDRAELAKALEINVEKPQ